MFFKYFSFYFYLLIYLFILRTHSLSSFLLTILFSQFDLNEFFISTQPGSELTRVAVVYAVSIGDD